MVIAITIQRCDCLNFYDFAVELVIGPRFGNILGGTAVLLTGPCFDTSDVLLCTFEDTKKDNGFVVNNYTAMCVSPTFQDIGWKSLTLSIIKNGEEKYMGQTQFYAGILNFVVE